MGYETSRRKNLETRKVKEQVDNLDLHNSKIKELKDLIDSLPGIEEEEKIDVNNNEYARYNKQFEHMASIRDFSNHSRGIDIEAVKKEEKDEGINSNTNSQTEEKTQEVLHQEEKVEISNAPLEFREYVGSLIGKYHANDYHRMMTSAEITKYADLYSKAYGVEVVDARSMIEDSINLQLKAEKSDLELQKQGLEQQKLMVMTNDYRARYGNNFMAYLSDEEVEKYGIQYLHSYNTRRSDFDKIYLDSLNKAFEDKMMENTNEETYARSRGFSIIKFLGLSVVMFALAIGIIGLSIIIK